MVPPHGSGVSDVSLLKNITALQPFKGDQIGLNLLKRKKRAELGLGIISDARPETFPGRSSDRNSEQNECVSA